MTRTVKASEIGTRGDAASQVCKGAIWTGQRFLMLSCYQSPQIDRHIQ